MKKSNVLFKLVLISLICNLSSPLFCEEKGDAKGQEEEIPQVMEDIRRFEIITLGALPFVMLDANLVYSGVQYFQNDMSSSYFPSFTPTLTKDEQTNLLLTSIGISVGIGLTDLIVNIVRRSKKNKKVEPEEKPIHIAPVAENPNATKLPSLEEMNIKSENKLENENIANDEVIEINEDNN